MFRTIVLFTSVLVLLPVVEDCYSAEPELLGTIHADTQYVLYGQDLVPLGDQNGDGTSELLVWDGRGSTHMFCGGQVFDSTIYMRFNNTNTWGGDLGDINGDGFADLALLGRSQYRWKMNVYFGGPLLDTVRDLWYGSDAYPPCIWAMRTADLNRNGRDEVIIVPCGMDEVQMYELDGGSDSLPDIVLHDLVLPRLKTGNWAAQIALGDFNGDGLQDLAVSQATHESSGENGRIHIFWGGPEFDSIPDLTIIRRGASSVEASQFGRVMTCPGDLNADGFDDLFVASGFADDTAWVFYGGSPMDTNPGIVMWGWVTHAAPAGDINRDGYDDLITSCDFSFSTAGRVLIFYGGPTFDSLPDARVNNWDFPYYLDHFGMAIAGLGDFNGDGVDDFAISALDALSRGVVFIYSGTGEPTDVSDEEKDLPRSFTLRQNYPNPFNPSTTIEFELATRRRVSLDVYNVLGQHVRTIAGGVNLGPGAYRYSWDAENDEGAHVATGVYLYRLRTPEFTQAKKMVMVR